MQLEGGKGETNQPGVGRGFSIGDCFKTAVLAEDLSYSVPRIKQTPSKCFSKLFLLRRYMLSLKNKRKNSIQEFTISKCLKLGPPKD